MCTSYQRVLLTANKGLFPAPDFYSRLDSSRSVVFCYWTAGSSLTGTPREGCASSVAHNGLDDSQFAGQTIPKWTRLSL